MFQKLACVDIQVTVNWTCVTKCILLDKLVSAQTLIIGYYGLIATVCYCLGNQLFSLTMFFRMSTMIRAYFGYLLLTRKCSCQTSLACWVTHSRKHIFKGKIVYHNTDAYRHIVTTIIIVISFLKNFYFERACKLRWDEFWLWRC